MHAYLIIAKDEELREEKTQSLLAQLGLIRFNSTINKIDDVRALSSFSKLGQKQNLGIVLTNIGTASLEALNAFLKNLEEPQANICYILTAESGTGIPETILSRCNVIKINNNNNGQNYTSLVKKLVGKNFSFKMTFIADIKSRQEAEISAENIIRGAHSLLLSGWNTSKMAKVVKSAETLRRALRANANVQLQLLNFVINLE